MAISQQLKIKLNQDSLHKVISYRNAFAHHSLNSNPTLLVGETPDKDELHYMLHIVTNSGKIEMKRRKNALEDFDKHYELAKKSLIELLEAISNSIAIPESS